MNTEDIIDAFYIASYDDLGYSRDVWTYIDHFLSKNGNPFSTLSIADYKSAALDMVINDLELLDHKIKEHISDAFVVNTPDMGYKYG